MVGLEPGQWEVKGGKPSHHGLLRTSLAEAGVATVMISRKPPKSSKLFAWDIVR